MQRRHLRREYVSFRHVRNQNPTKAGIPLCRCRHISPLRFLHALKRQALIFSLPSHPHQACFYRCALICFIVSFIWLCLTPFTAAPRICGLPFTYRVSAVRFAWLCGEDWLYCPLNFKFPNKKSPRSSLGLFCAYMTLFLFKIAGIICIYRFALCKNNNRHNVQS